MPDKKRLSGFKELGLPYASDTAVTKHLLKFLKQNINKINTSAGSKTFIHPTKVLFNGGVLKAGALSKRILDVINKWIENEHSESASLLKGSDLDKAVALGSAFYGFALRGKGIRVKAGAGRSYYIGVETAMPAVPGMSAPMKAICVVPFGMEEGTDIEIPEHEFGLVVGEHSVFSFLSSIVRKEDRAGAVIQQWEEGEIEELAPLETTLTAEGMDETLVPVQLHSYLTEIGTLELWCEAKDDKNRWKLEFNVREES
ncbi:molecular chaperone DnaK [Candidatus Magnetoovum chiemensis]|nr:molecular chaperone DnaK [Candidatus Magnetoovum chiemensis]